MPLIKKHFWRRIKFGRKPQTWAQTNQNCGYCEGKRDILIYKVE